MKNEKNTNEQINYVIWNNTCVMRKSQLTNRFRKGAVVLYKFLEELDDHIEVFGHISYQEGWSKEQYLEALKKEDVNPKIFKCNMLILKPENAHSIFSENSLFYKYPSSESGCQIPEVTYEIKKWLQKVSFNQFLKEITERVMGQKDVVKIVANVYNYLSCIAYGKPHNSNTMIAAPSGCGKTETYRAIRDYFAKAIPDLLIYQIDMTSLTEEGFKGNDTKYLIQPLLERSSSKGVGIVFLDEFDKKLMPSLTSTGSNVNAAVQAQILTIVEGRMFSDSKSSSSVNTAYTMFIALGAYNSCRQKREEVEHKIGFEKQDDVSRDHYAAITRQDMIDVGGSYELIGRFSTIVNYYTLKGESVDRIIDNIVKKEEVSFGCQIILGTKMRKELHQNANSRYGCRLLGSLIHEAVLDGYMELLQKDANLSQTVIHIESSKKITIEERQDTERLA